MDASFGKELADNKSFGTGDNPEKSENERETPGAKIIAIGAEGAKGFSKTVDVSSGEGTAFLINHGAGHNAGLNHDDFTIMASGQNIYIHTGSPLKNSGSPFQNLNDFINAPGNKGEIRNAFIKRFGNDTPIAHLPTTPTN